VHVVTFPLLKPTHAFISKVSYFEISARVGFNQVKVAPLSFSSLSLSPYLHDALGGRYNG
jgi:hypothetical protein